MAKQKTRGETIDAQQAEHWGIVSRVVSHDTPLAESEALARTIAGYPVISVRTIKEMLHRGCDDDYRREDVLTPGLLVMDDLKEGRRAFKEKRPPRFKGRWETEMLDLTGGVAVVTGGGTGLGEAAISRTQRGSPVISSPAAPRLQPSS
jgi:hypothetical protein